MSYTRPPNKRSGRDTQGERLRAVSAGVREKRGEGRGAIKSPGATAGMEHNVVKLKNIKRYVPWRALPIARAAYRTYMRLLIWYVDLRERRYAGKTGLAHMPPAYLRYRVHGSPYAKGFLKMGRRCSEDIEAALEKVGKNFDSFQNVLDFGC